MALAVRGVRGMVTILPLFAQNGQSPVSTLEAKGFDICAGRF
jgi:hypothetical protein